MRLVNGKWQEKVIWNFITGTTGLGGFNPYAGVILDAAGNLYGTTSACTCSYTNQGAVFELLRGQGGAYSEKVLHYFYSNGVDGYNPVASLVFGSAGTLYGTTSQGGTYNAGTVFELSPAPSGMWKEKILHNFGNTSTDGGFPIANLTLGLHGVLYGTTSGGGPQGYGTVFELVPVRGDWNETVLYSFVEGGSNGGGPSSPVTLDALGNLYSTAAGYGAYDGGNVFEIVP
jgi:uncharacterized repeat protein (TIGR03803 family)